MSRRYLRIDGNSPYHQLVGVGGVGSGIFFELEGDHTLGRNESRLGRLLDVRDYCKLHIIVHYVAKLLGTRLSERSFRVTPIANVGDDAAGQRLLREMSEAGIDTSRMQTLAAAPTLFSVCFQYPDSSGGNVTTSNSAAGLLSKHQIDDAASLLRAGGRQVIALAAPEVPLEMRRYFLEVASGCGAFRAASFAAAEVRPARESGMFNLLDLVSLNQNEGEELVGCAFSPHLPETFVSKCQELLRQSYPSLKVVVSAGKLGAYGITARAHEFCSAPEVKVASTAGAGDSLLGGILAALAAGIPLLNADSVYGDTQRQVDSALQLGVLLGSYKCRSPHTIHPHASLDTLIEFAEERGLFFSPRIEKYFVRNSLMQSAE